MPICVTDMLQISTAELAAKAEETRGQLRHLDQQVGLCVCVCVCVCVTDRETHTDRWAQVSMSHMAVSACQVRHVNRFRDLMKQKAPK